MAHELVLIRLPDAPLEKLFCQWSDPDTCSEWFCPAPWTVSHTEFDFRAGGANRITINGPNGAVVENPSQFLEAIPKRRIVLGDAFIGDWLAKDGAPLTVATVTFEPEDDKTRYKAVCNRWSEAYKQQHEKMGLTEGWSAVVDQLEPLDKKK